jgi:hypothetical protein
MCAIIWIWKSVPQRLYVRGMVPGLGLLTGGRNFKSQGLVGGYRWHALEKNCGTLLSSLFTFHPVLLSHQALSTMLWCFAISQKQLGQLQNQNLQNYKVKWVFPKCIVSGVCYSVWKLTNNGFLLCSVTIVKNIEWNLNVKPTLHSQNKWCYGSGHLCFVPDFRGINWLYNTVFPIQHCIQ